MAGIERLAAKIYKIKAGEKKLVLTLGLDAKGRLSPSGNLGKFEFDYLEFFDGSEDKPRIKLRASTGVFDHFTGSPNTLTFRVERPFPLVRFDEIPVSANGEPPFRGGFVFDADPENLFANDDSLRVRVTYDAANYLGSGAPVLTDGLSKYYSLNQLSDFSKINLYERRIFGTNAKKNRLERRNYPLLANCLSNPKGIEFKDRRDLCAIDPHLCKTYPEARAIGLRLHGVRYKDPKSSTCDFAALSAHVAVGPVKARKAGSAELVLDSDSPRLVAHIDVQKEIDFELVQDVFHQLDLDGSVTQVDKALFSYLHVRPLSPTTFAAVWNERIAKPYLAALRTVDDARDLSFIPLLESVESTTADNEFEALFDLPQTPVADDQERSATLVALRPIKSASTFIADAVFPGLLMHDGQPVRRRVKMTVDRATLEQTFEWFDLRISASTQPRITVKLADEGKTGIGNWVRVGALDLRVPDTTNAKKAEVAAGIDVTFDVTFDPADPTAKTYASAACDPKGISGRSRLPRQGEAVPRITTRIDRFELSNVRPGSQDPVPDATRAFDAVLTDLIRAGSGAQASPEQKRRITREERIQRDLTRSAALVFVDGEPDAATFFLRGEEVNKADRNRRLALTLHRTMTREEDAYRTVVIDPEPLTVALVNVPSFLGGDHISETDGEIANWETSELEGTRWEIARITDGFDLFFPPQATGEAMEKGEPWPEISSDDKSSKAIDYRLGTAARLNLRSSYFRQRYAEAPWNLRRVLGYAGQRAPGAGLVTARFEFLYGLAARFTAPGLRLAELVSRVGAIREPLPARPSSVMRRLGGLGGTEQRDVEAELYDRFRDISASFAKGLGTRVARFEAYREGSEDPLSVEERVAFELRVPNQNGPRQEEDADIVLKPYSPTPGAGLLGGATWGIESKNIYEEVIGGGYPKSTRGQILNPAFSALGGSGFTRAFFANGKSRIVADTAFGRTNVYAIERIGRIGVFWNIAKHVIVYERTVLPSEQFADAQPRHAGRPINRKVQEYIELIELDRNYPEKSVAPKTRGFVEACLFRTQRIPVDGRWGYDIPQGWVIPLWKANADPRLYPKSDVRLQLSAAQSDAAASLAARFKDPSQLLFFTSTRQEDGDDPNIWPARNDVDFINVPRPTPVGAPTIDPSNPDGRAADDLMRDPLVDRCTFDIDSSGEAANLAMARSTADPIGAVLETVTMMRAAPTGADGGAAGQALALRHELERIVTDAKRWEVLLQEALKTARETLGRLLSIPKEQGTEVVKREAGRIRGLKDGVHREAAKARSAIDQAVTRAKANYEAAKSGWTEDGQAFRDRLKRELQRNLTDRLKTIVEALTTLEEKTGDFASDLADPKLAMAVAQRVEDALEPARQLILRGIGRIDGDLDKFERAVALARDEMMALHQMVSKTAGEMTAAVDSVQTDKDLNRLLVPYEDFHAKALAALDSVDRVVRRDLPKYLKKLPIFAGGKTISEFIQIVRTALLDAHNGAFKQITAVTISDITLAKAATKRFIVQAVQQAETVRQAADDLVIEAAKLTGAAKGHLAGFTEGVDAKFDNLMVAIRSACEEAIDGTITLDELVKVVQGLVATLRAEVAQLEKNVAGAVTSIDGAIGGVLDEVGGTIGDAEAELEKTLNAAADFAKDGVTALENRLVSGIDEVADQLENNAEDLGAAIVEARQKLENAAADVIGELQKRDLGAVSDALRVLEEGYKRLSRAPTFQSPSETLALIRAAGSAPLLPNLQFNRERIAYFFDDLRDAVKTSPVVALMNRLDDDLQALGIRLPTSELLERLIPKDLDKIDFGRLFPDLGGLKLDGLFKNLKLPASLNEHVKLTHGFDKASLSAWAKAEAKSNLPKRAEVFAFGPLKLIVVDAAFNALADLAIGIDGALRRSTKAHIVGDWELAFGGQALVTLEQTRIDFENGKGLNVDIDPSRIRFDRAIKFLSDLIKQFSEPDSGFFLEMLEENGMPAGIAARLELPLPPLSFGAFSIWGLRFSSSFGLHMVKGTGVRRGEFAIATSLALGRKVEPFTMRVWILVGGGWLETRAKYFPTSGRLTTGVSIGITAGVGIDFAFGPCRGFVFVMFGAYVEFSSEGSGSTHFSVAVILLVRGGIVILGRFNIGLYLLLEIIYQQDGTVLGRGTIEVTFKICWCVKITVRQSVTYRLAGGSRALARRRSASPHYLDSFA